MYRSGCGCNQCGENRGAGCERREWRCGCNENRCGNNEGRGGSNENRCGFNDWGNNEEFERMERLNREILRRRSQENHCARNFNHCIRNGQGNCGGCGSCEEC